MCEDWAGYSTVVGPRWQIEWLIERWETLRTPDRLGIERPTMVRFHDVHREAAQRFEDDWSPAIAVAHHPPGFGMRATAQLQAELMQGPRGRSAFWDARPYHEEPHLLWEPGYRFRSAQQEVAGIPDDAFDPDVLDALVQSAPAVPRGPTANGHRVAVLDTGVRGAAHDMIDFINCHDVGITTTPAADPHGHGTAVASVITAVRSSADIHPLRVLREDNQGESYEVLAGLVYTLWSGAYDLVNASLTTDVSGQCATSLGRSVDYLLSYCSAEVAPPVLVAAAGNWGPAHASGYPACLPDAVVALATDDTGARASYNCTPPPGAIEEEAYGGSDAQPLGTLPDGTRLFGTSFAAAAVSGAYLP
ncbi:S8 family serine peptidase [Streptomyces virginiae]|uniref:S8 family peptidase n=1 Tax=Streptomyces virginiae TaxID=1961 RepID=UPI00369900BE